VFGAESIYFRLDFQFRILKSDQAHSSVTSLSFPPVPHVSHPTANPRSHLSVSFLHYCRTPRLLCFSCCCRYAALLPPFAACQLLVAVRARTSHSSACLAIKTEPPTPRHLCFFLKNHATSVVHTARVTGRQVRWTVVCGPKSAQWLVKSFHFPDFAYSFK
jgi:hypothetical protein